MLTIDNTVYDAMLAAAQRAAPLEACGLLAGREGQMTAFYELTNADASETHYTMIPEEQFTAIKDMRARGLTLLAIWHSHPANPARFSEEDLRLAYTPDVIYIVLSLLVPEAPLLRAFVVEDGRPAEEPITIERAALPQGDTARD